jgi:hypothetical protein
MQPWQGRPDPCISQRWSRQAGPPLSRWARGDAAWITRCGDVCPAGEVRSARKAADSDFTVSPPMELLQRSKPKISLCWRSPESSNF